MGCLQFVIVVFPDHTHFMLSLYDDYQGDVIEAFNYTSSDLDDLLNINNPCFKQMIGQICPIELQLNKANSFVFGFPHGALGLSAFVIVVFPDHTNLLFLSIMNGIAS